MNHMGICEDCVHYGVYLWSDSGGTRSVHSCVLTENITEGKASCPWYTKEED